MSSLCTMGPSVGWTGLFDWLCIKDYNEYCLACSAYSGKLFSCVSVIGTDVKQRHAVCQKTHGCSQVKQFKCIIIALFSASFDWEVV